MSRIAKAPVELPKGVEVRVADGVVYLKGVKGARTLKLNSNVHIQNEDNKLKLSPINESTDANALAGTTRALLQNMVIGVSKRFERKLELVGVAYRAKAQGKNVNMVLG